LRRDPSENRIRWDSNDHAKPVRFTSGFLAIFACRCPDFFLKPIRGSAPHFLAQRLLLAQLLGPTRCAHALGRAVSEAGLGFKFYHSRAGTFSSELKLNTS
jgi:hypothetical protein